MKRRDIINISLVIVFIVYLLFYKIIIIPKYLKLENIITAIFIISLTFIAYLLLGFKHTKDNEKRKRVRYLILYEIVIYFFIYFGTGIILGFQNNIYSLNITNIIFNILAPFIIIIFEELFRNIVIQSNKDKKYIIIIFTLLLTIIELLSMINYYGELSISSIFKMISCGLIPLVTKHSMLSYLTYNTGFKNSLIYRLIMTLYIFFVPIIPNLGEYLTCIIEIIFPVIIYLSISKIFLEHEYVEVDIKKKKIGALDIIFTIVFIGIVSIVGGIFNVKLISIASNSMSPCFNRGDSVMIKKYNNIYEVGDIISFDNNGINTVHRITKIEVINDIKYYHTKGDSNNSEDNLLVSYNNIYGKVLFKIPYIGYPSVLINEYRSGLIEK